MSWLALSHILVEDLQTRLLNSFTTILKNVQTLHLKHLDIMRTHFNESEAALGALNPRADLDLFIDHNISAFSPPPDWSFEPCSSHYDHVCNRTVVPSRHS